MIISKNIDFRIYSRQAYEDTCKEFSEFCTFKENKIDNQNIIFKINIKGENKNRGKEIILEFFNYMLDLTCQKRLNIT